MAIVTIIVTVLLMIIFSLLFAYYKSIKSRSMIAEDEQGFESQRLLSVPNSFWEWGSKLTSAMSHAGAFEPLTNYGQYVQVTL
jgi:hypothetical protein